MQAGKGSTSARRLRPAESLRTRRAGVLVVVLAILFVLGSLIGARSAQAATSATSATSATNSFTFEGTGFGHGLGFSQWGAWYAAHNEGKTWQEIVRFYYHGPSAADPVTIASLSPANPTLTVKITSAPWATSHQLTYNYVNLAASVGPLTLVMHASGAAPADTQFFVPAGSSLLDLLVKSSAGKVYVSTDGLLDTDPHKAWRGPYDWVEARPANVETSRVRVKLWTGSALNPREYWGTLRMTPASSSSNYLNVTNLVPVEKYLRGIREVLEEWAIPGRSAYAIEAVKAQTVAARSYAMATAAENGFLYDDGWSQCYVGYTGPNSSGDAFEVRVPGVAASAEATSGQVLMYRGRPIRAFFSTHNGGYTASSPWGPTPGYTPVQPDPWSAKAPLYLPGPSYPWSYTISAQSLSDKLNNRVKDTSGKYLNLGLVARVEVASRDTVDATSHAKTMRITGQSGASAIVSAWDFLCALSMNNIKSTLFTKITNPAVSVTPARFDQSDARLTYVGLWRTRSDGNACGQCYSYLASPGAVLVSFTGTKIGWIAHVGPDSGKARVTLDGKTPVEVDLYSAGQAYQRTMWSSGTLASGKHTLVVQYTGKTSAPSGGREINVDAFDITGSLTQAAPLARCQQNDVRLVYAGSWTVSYNPAASNGSYRCTDTAGGTVTIRFNGRSLDWIATKSVNYGKARVSVDGGTPRTVDLYNPTTVFDQKVWSTGLLPSGMHTVKIERTGVKTVATAGAKINVDAFDVLGALAQAPAEPKSTRYEQGDARLSYTGAWVVGSVTGPSGGSWRYVDAAASVTIKFTGTSLAWIAKKSPVYGRAKISVDGKAAVTVDLYDTATLWQQKVWSTGTLNTGTHTVKIQWTGAKSSAGGGTNISIDAVDILGTLVQA